MNAVYAKYVTEAVVLEKAGCWADAAKEWAKAAVKARKRENQEWCAIRAEVCEKRSRKNRPLTAAKARRLTK